MFMADARSMWNQTGLPGKRGKRKKNRAESHGVEEDEV